MAQQTESFGRLGGRGLAMVLQKIVTWSFWSSFLCPPSWLTFLAERNLFLFLKIFFIIVDLQCSVNFFYTAKWPSHIYVHVYAYTHTHTHIHILFLLLSSVMCYQMNGFRRNVLFCCSLGHSGCPLLDSELVALGGHSLCVLVPTLAPGSEMRLLDVCRCAVRHEWWSVPFPLSDLGAQSIHRPKRSG